MARRAVHKYIVSLASKSFHRMPTGTRSARALTLRVVTVAGEEMQLEIRSDQLVRKLHRQVRILTNQRNAFDLVHNERGTIFGAQADYGSKAWWETANKKLCNLRVRTGDVITQVMLAPSVDSDGEEIPALVSDIDSDDTFLVLASHSETCAFGSTTLPVYAEEERRVEPHDLCPASQTLHAAISSYLCFVKGGSGKSTLRPSALQQRQGRVCRCRQRIYIHEAP